MQNPHEQHAKVGVAVIVQREGDGAVLFGLRRSGHGKDTWSIPGGHVDTTDKSVAWAAARELSEETGITVPYFDLKLVPHVGLTHFGDAVGSYVTVYYFTRVRADVQPEECEPTKMTRWGWYTQPPVNLFLPARGLIHALNIYNLGL